MIKHLLLTAAAAALVACSQNKEDTEPPAAPAPAEETAPADESTEAAVMPSAEERLDAALAAQSEAAKARYQWRHPKETLEFFGVEPGMTVVEALPGEGWYSKILVQYLGSEGRLIGADYALDMWPLFGDQIPAEMLATRASWAANFPAEADPWCEADCAAVSAFNFGAAPAELAGTADAVLFIRALHNMARFEGEGGYMTAAINEAKTLLKPGGIVGVVQHRAPATSADDWASGGAGYLKQDAIIAVFENAGFDFVEASEINANPNDQPGAEDVVWRLPPSFYTSADNPELKTQMEAIGESDRMTLKFKKPE
ncbi:MAG: class I SAM-dependent methyltransferase [Amphiplicatus sp.]